MKTLLLNRRVAFLAAAFSVLLTFGACKAEKRPEGFPELHPCSVKITQGGVPLADAVVSLVAQDSSLARWPCGANTDENGVAKLATYGFDGAPVGTFKVVVMKTEIVGGPQNAEESRRQMQGEDFGVQETFQLVEAQYRDQTRTPHTIEIKPGSNPEQTFDVGEAVREAIEMP